MLVELEHAAASPSGALAYILAAFYSVFVERTFLTSKLSKDAVTDFFADPLPESDVLVMGRILHNWDLPTRKLLLEKGYQALPKGGALIVYDPLIDDARCVEAHGLLSSLNMLIETKGGSEYTGAECMYWLQQAGFRETHIEPLGDVHTAVIGFKNGG
jgi:hypothetical protein